MKELQLDSKPENLGTMMDFISDSITVSAVINSKVCVICDEILSNIVNYSDATYMKVSIEQNANITLVFSDNGSAFNPILQKEPDLTSDASERQIGGLGIFLVKKLVDDISYVRESGKNIITVVIKL